MFEEFRYVPLHFFQAILEFYLTFVTLVGSFDQMPQGQAKLTIQDNVADSQSLSPQGIGILGAARLDADGKATCDIIYFVGNAKNFPGQAGREDITGKTRQVMFKNSQRHLFFLTIAKGVFPAHKTLQFWKLINHIGNKVGFGKVSSPPGMLHLLLPGTQGFAKILRQVLYSAHLIVNTPQAFLKNNFSQGRHFFSQGRLQVFLVKKVSVGQTGPQNFFIAGADNIQVISRTVLDGNKFGKQAAVRS
ncbi:MAG: hypothetical protein BWY80_01246 [Firmicutes bacterium ADurb.Bin456]|nr:MAG: hypothetical protein BWY80_01246 [Firmicutes bacterium ADurb.Bin456]